MCKISPPGEASVSGSQEAAPQEPYEAGRISSLLISAILQVTLLMGSCWWGGRNNSAVMGGLSKASLLAHALMRCVLWYICKGRLGVFWLKNTVFLFLFF